MMKWLLFISVIILFTISCGQKKTIGDKPKKGRRVVDTSMLDITRSRDINTFLCQRWEHADDHELPYLNEDDEDEVPMRAFCFFNDGSLVKDPRNKVQVGKWVFDAATKVLEVGLNGKRERYKVKGISYKTLWLLGEDEYEPKRYRAVGLIHKNDMDDPFYLPNIQWMQAPSMAEDDAAILSRVKSCLHFYYLFYTDCYKREQTEIFFYGFPDPLDGMMAVYP